MTQSPKRMTSGSCARIVTTPSPAIRSATGTHGQEDAAPELADDDVVLVRADAVDADDPRVGARLRAALGDHGRVCVERVPVEERTDVAQVLDAEVRDRLAGDVR